MDGSQPRETAAVPPALSPERMLLCDSIFLSCPAVRLSRYTRDYDGLPWYSIFLCMPSAKRSASSSDLWSLISLALWFLDTQHTHTLLWVFLDDYGGKIPLRGYLACCDLGEKKTTLLYKYTTHLTNIHKFVFNIHNAEPREELPTSGVMHSNLSLEYSLA